MRNLPDYNSFYPVVLIESFNAVWKWVYFMFSENKLEAGQCTAGKRRKLFPLSKSWAPSVRFGLTFFNVIISWEKWCRIWFNLLRVSRYVRSVCLSCMPGIFCKIIFLKKKSLMDVISGLMPLICDLENWFPHYLNDIYFLILWYILVFGKLFFFYLDLGQTTTMILFCSFYREKKYNIWNHLINSFIKMSSVTEHLRFSHCNMTINDYFTGETLIENYLENRDNFVKV